LVLAGLVPLALLVDTVLLLFLQRSLLMVVVAGGLEITLGLEMLAVLGVAAVSMPQFPAG